MHSNHFNLKSHTYTLPTCITWDTEETRVLLSSPAGFRSLLKWPYKHWQNWWNVAIFDSLLIASFDIWRARLNSFTRCKQPRGESLAMTGSERSGMNVQSQIWQPTTAGAAAPPSWLPGRLWRLCGCSTPRPPCQDWWASLSRCNTSRSKTSRSCGATRLRTSDNMDNWDRRMKKRWKVRTKMLLL